MTGNTFLSIKRNMIHKSQLLLHLSLILFGLIIIFPYLWMVLTSFKPSGEVLGSITNLLPHHWQAENYITVMSTGPFFRYFLNTLIVTVAGVLLETLISFLGAYAFARLNFFGKEFFFYLILGTIMIPPQVLMLPSYLLVGKLGWLNTYQALIIPRVGGAFGIFLIRQFMLGVPKELDDAASVDGAGLLRRLFSIYLPLCLPALITVAVFSMLGFWNDYYWPLIVTSSDEMRTLALGIDNFKSVESLGHWELLMAAASIASAPMIAAFLVFRKMIVGNLAEGAIKG